MNHLELPATSDLCASPTPPCSILAQLRLDLAEIAKSKTLPYSRRYNLTDKEFIRIDLVKLDDGQFHLKVESARGTVESTDIKLKKLIDLEHLLVWRALSLCLSRNVLLPCATMAHKGADEILALYSCVDNFRKTMTLPFVVSIDSPEGKYNLISIVQRDNLIDLVLETRSIYGNPMTWRAEFHHVYEVVERADKIIAEVMSEWIMPGGHLLRAERERVNAVGNGK